MTNLQEGSQIVALFQFQGDQADSLNQKLMALPDEARFHETIQYYKLWVQSFLKADQRTISEAQTIFGSLFESQKELQSSSETAILPFEFLTLTSRSSVLRVWYQRPSCMLRKCRLPQKSICRCCGLFLGIYGNPSIVERYVKEMLLIYNFPNETVVEGDYFYFRD